MVIKKSHIYNTKHYKIIKMNEILKHVSMLWEHYVKGKNNDTKYHQLYNFVFDVESRWTQTVRKWSFPGPEVGKKLEGPLLSMWWKIFSK